MTSALLLRVTAWHSGSLGRRARPLGRLARGAAIATVLALAAYLVGMNVFLRTRMFRGAITSDSGSLRVEYRTAYSLWPGRIHVEDLAIRGRDGSVEWVLSLDRCDFRVSFLALARRRFHASHVEGDGLSLRIRLRRDGPVSPEEMRALPPVPGFLDPPLKDVGPPPPPLTDANYNLWSIELDDVDADHVRELWIDTVRYSGDLEVRGRWFFRPLRWLDVGPATVGLRALDVAYGMVEPWLSGVTGELTATVHPFALQEVDGPDILDRVSVDGDVHGTLRTATVLSRILGSESTVRADDAAVDARMDLNHGVLRSGTQVHVDRFALEARTGPVTVDAALTADVQVDDGDTAHLNVEGKDFRAAKSGGDGVAAKGFAANAQRHALDLARVRDPLDLAGNLEVENLDARFDGTRAAAPRFSIATGKARLQAGAEPAGGEFTLSADALSVERKDVAGKADLFARIAAYDRRSPTERTDFAGSEVQLRNAGLSVGGAHVVVPSLEARTRSLALVGSRPAGRVALEVPEIEVPLALVPNALLLLPKVVSIESGRARAMIQADVDLDRLAATGDARVVTEGLRAHVGGQPVTGDLHFDVRAREKEGATELSGSKLTFDGAVGDGGSPWWVRATLAQASLDARSGLRFRGHATATAKNGAPLVAIVSKGTPIPAWVLNLVSTEGLTVSGDLVISPTTFQARSVTARADGVDLGFELAELGSEREWALLVDVGLVSAGIDVANDKTDVLLFGAKSWFEKKTASLRAVEQRYE